MKFIRFASLLFLLSFAFCSLFAQDNQSPLTIETIMQGYDWVGHSPHNEYWADDSQSFYFSWNPENALNDSLYIYSLEDGKYKKMSQEERFALKDDGRFNSDKTKRVYSKHGDLFVYDLETKEEKRILQTIKTEGGARFSADDKKIVFTQDNNLFTWDLETNFLKQLTNFKKGSAKSSGKSTKNEQDQWLADQEVELMAVLKRKKEEQEQREEAMELENEAKENYEPQKEIEPYYYGSKRLRHLRLSPDEKFITFTTTQEAGGTKTIVPKYVTASGLTIDSPSRTNVGHELPIYQLGIYDIEKDTIYFAKTKTLPGIFDEPEFMKKAKKDNSDDGDKEDSEDEEDSEFRKVRPTFINTPKWSDDGKNAVFIIQTMDNKDHWVALLDLETGDFKNLNHQHDDAWIGGPGISQWRGYDQNNIGWLPDNKRVWFQSEESGWSHVYTVDIDTKKKKQITKGEYEVYTVQISEDDQYWYFTSSEGDLGERHFYRLPIDSKGKTAPERLTSMQGNNDVQLSPDEKHLLIRYSYSNQPWELYLQKNEPNAEAKRITESQSKEFKNYAWRVPEIVDIKARDGETIKARLYRPNIAEASAPKKAYGSAVVFVHGAGYLQNVHHWWSSYYREYMFHNFLVDNGYTVLDIDYRGSEGYGSKWRTDVYRSMGDKDLTDHIDGVEWLVKNHGIDPERVGIYGGSYGGFITLMALFKNPETFACGAALRSVTDWAHYNHLYTANRLNTPVLDSMAYRQCSPIYFAEGLEDPLLICHGMIDSNVHFQDVVRLSQRLIELGKDDWEMAVYPLEGHSFVEPESWADEYKRIYKLFEQHLPK